MDNPGDDELLPKNKVVKRRASESSIGDVKDKRRADHESGIIKVVVFPDDIVIDIVSRLPAESVIRFCCTCKSVRDLIATRDFVELHIRRSSIPMILVINVGGGHEDLLLENCWGYERSRSKFHKSCSVYREYYMQLSQDGLIVSKRYKKNENDFIIFNPVYSENVTITVPSRPASEICGVFYQSRLKEYCILWEITVSTKPRQVQYHMLNLGCQPYWKEIKNPWNQNGRISAVRPVLVDCRYLYWIVEPEPNFRYNNYEYATTIIVDIMEFDTTNEQFEMFPSPVPVIFCKGKCNISLLNANGLLLLVQISFVDMNIMNIWTLKDRAKKLWESSSYITGINKGLSFHPRYIIPKAIAFWNGELVFCNGYRLLVCNLSQETTREFGKYQFSANIMSHVISFASLKNCKSKIHMQSFNLSEPP